MKEIIKKEFVEHIEISKKTKNLLLEVIEEAAVLCIPSCFRHFFRIQCPYAIYRSPKKNAVAVGLRGRRCCHC